MTNTEAIVFFGDGASSSAKNYYSTGHVKPTLASTQSVTSTVTTSSQTITMTTRRALDPAVAQQFSIPLDTDITMGYATNDQTNSLNTVHNLFGSWTFNLASDGSSSGGTGGGGSSSDGEDDSDDEVEDESDDEAEDGEVDSVQRSKKKFRLNACATPYATFGLNGEESASALYLQLSAAVFILTSLALV